MAWGGSGGGQEIPALRTLLALAGHPRQNTPITTHGLLNPLPQVPNMNYGWPEELGGP